MFEKGDKPAPYNYRPVTLTSVFSKIFEYCFLHKLDSFLNIHRVLELNQFGFRTSKSTSDAVLNFLNYVLQSAWMVASVRLGFFVISAGHSTALITTDCWGSWLTVGSGGVPLEWISTYLRDRPQYVSITSSLDGSITQEVNSSLISSS